MRLAVAALALATLGSVLVGCGGPASPSAPATPGGDLGATVPANTDTVEPVALRIPSINLDSRQISKESFEPLGIAADGSMETTPVSDPTRFGWYCPQAMPKCGAPYPGQIGGSVIGAHVNGNGKQGGLFKLAKVTGDAKVKFNVAVGDAVDVDLADGTTQHFKITELLSPSKHDFPVQKVWGYVDHPRLSLITCGGDYDAAHHNYLNQVIVIADWESASGG